MMALAIYITVLGWLAVLMTVVPMLLGQPVPPAGLAIVVAVAIACTACLANEIKENR